jgi:hypothetical protein
MKMIGQDYHLLGSKPWRIKSSDGQTKALSHGFQNVPRAHGKSRNAQRSTSNAQWQTADISSMQFD